MLKNFFIQIVATTVLFFGKIHLKVPSPPPYTPELWSYNKADRKNIQVSIKNVAQKLTIRERVELLSNTLINIFRNYIPNKKVQFQYGEAPWINKNIKSALRNRSRLTKGYYVNGQVQSD